MNPLAAVAVAARAMASALALFVRPRIWAPFLLVLLIQAVILLLLISFHRPEVLPLGLPLVRLLAGEGATQYIAFHLALPVMVGRAELFVSIAIGSVATGVATVLFANAYGTENEDHPWRRALRKAPALIGLAALSAIVFLAIRSLGVLLPETSFSGNRALYVGREIIDLLVFLVVQSLLAYATAWIVLGGRRILPALVDSMRVASRTLVPTVLVIGIPAVLLYPLKFVTGHAELLVSRFRPEVVTWLLAAQLVTEILATFVVVGAITRLFTWRMRRSA